MYADGDRAHIRFEQRGFITTWRLGEFYSFYSSSLTRIFLLAYFSYTKANNVVLSLALSLFFFRAASSIVTRLPLLAFASLSLTFTVSACMPSLVLVALVRSMLAGYFLFLVAPLGMVVGHVHTGPPSRLARCTLDWWKSEKDEWRK